jgi:hypothetical protein
MTGIGMTTAGTIAARTGDVTNGAGMNGAGSRPAAKPNAVVIGSAIRIGPWGIDTKIITATIVARAW